jgi:long-subunit acyl-CoA synthetase (AMP-forming)
VYTSGTSGIPKAVMHKYYNFSFTNILGQPYLGFGNNERFFSYLPLSHIAERNLVEMGSIYSGGKVYFSESLDTFPKNLAEAKPTIFLGVHRIWKKFQESILNKIPQEKLDRMLKIPVLSGLIKRKIKKGLGLANATNIFTGAAPTPVSLIKWFDAIGIKIQEAYAMTENCCYSHVTRNGNIKIGWVGQTFPGCEAKIDVNNEILIRHEALMTGYYKDPVATENAFTSDGFLRTGDQGAIDKEGFLKITGRVKDIFKTSKGKYIIPSVIEMKISGLSEIEFVCVVGSGLPQPIALITLSESGKKKTRAILELTMDNVLAALNSTLNHHEHLAKIVVLKEPWTVENNLLTPSFKVKRGEIELRYDAQFEEWYAQKGALIWENQLLPGV